MHCWEMKIAIICFPLSLCLIGCGNKKIDASVEEETPKSINEVRQSLPEPDRAKFDEALQIVASNHDGPVNAEKIKAAVHGKTADEILKESQRIRNAKIKENRAVASKEIIEIEKRIHDALEARTELAKFTVEKARFHKEKTQFETFSVIELTVTNGTSKPVSRISFMGSSSSLGRAVPWVKDDFNYSISGGIEPGEKKELRLRPSFGAWDTANPPIDAILTVSVTRLDGADGLPFLVATDALDADTKRLEALKKWLADHPEGG